MNLKKLLVNSWPFILILAVSALFFWKVFLLKQVPIPGDFVVGVYYPWLDYKWGYATGVPVKNPMTTDVVSLIYPEQMMAIDIMKSGQWPLWNSTILAGTPLLANLQAAPFSPTNFLYFVFDKLTAWSWQIILQHILATLFAYLLLRHWKVSKLSSVLGGIVYSFAGFNLIFSQWNGHTLTSAFIPLVILLEDHFISKGTLLDGLGISFALTFQLFSGYPQTSLYTAVAMVLFWLFNFSKKRKFFVRTALLGIFIILALGLSSLQILPTAELWSLSQRSFEPHPYEWAFLPWSKIITFIAPDYFGNHATKNYWGPQDYTSNTAFIGVVGFILVGLSLWYLKKKKEISYLATLAAVSLILSFPTFVSVFFWANNIFGMRASSAHRATILFDFAAAALAGFGLDFLMKEKIKLKHIISSIIAPFLLLLGFTFATAYLYFVTKGSPDFFRFEIPKYIVGLRNLVFPGLIFILASTTLVVIVKFNKLAKLGAILLIVLTVWELFRFGWKFTPFSDKHLIFPTTPVLNFLLSQKKTFRVTGNRVIPVNMRSPYNLDSLEGYETIHPLRISQFLAALNSGISGTEPVGRYGTVDNDTSPLLDLVNTKYYLVLKVDKNGNPSPEGKVPDRYQKNRFRLVFEDRTVAVLEGREALPRAFMVFDWQSAVSDRNTLDTLLQKGYPYDKKIIVENYTKAPDGGAGKFEVKYNKYFETESQIEVKTTKAGLLFISDTFFPGWYAFVDGRETPMYRADFAFRTIPVAEGTHSIKMVYRPASFTNGIRISAASLIFLLLMIFAANTLKIREI